MGHTLERPSHRLTRRQQEIVQLLGAGWAEAEIAHRLGLSLGTVRRYIGRLADKTDVSRIATDRRRQRATPACSEP
jgi:DNA-binding NarL/FixJ family response regulator